MQYLIEGILLGLTLACLMGPIFVVLIQSSIEKGTRGGLMAAAGIWFSDILIVGLCMRFITNIQRYIINDDFKLWVGVIGALVLMGVGIKTFFKKAAKVDFQSKKVSKSGVLGSFVTGFLVNTINPFTIIFWFSTITALVAERGLSAGESWVFLGAIIITIMITDFLKVVFARVIRRKLQATSSDETISKEEGQETVLKRLGLINKIAGAALFVFGIALGARVLLFA